MLLEIAIGLSALALLALVVSPIWGIALLFIIKPLVDAVFEQPLVYGLHLTEIVAGTAPLIVIGHMLLAAPEQSVRHMPFRWLWTLYLLDALVFSILIAFHEDPRTGVNIFFRYLNGFVGFFMIQAFFQRDRDFKKLLGALLLAGLFPVAVACYQMATGTIWRAEQTEGIARTIGLWHDAVNLREYALQTIFAIVLYGALYVRGNQLMRGLLTAYLGTTLLVLLKVFSKAGTISLIAWTICWTVVRRKYSLLLGFLGGGAVVLVVAASGYLAGLQRLFHKEIGLLTGKGDLSHTFAGRWYGWFDMIDAWSKFSLPAQLFGSGQLALGAHNDYLQMLYHGGLVGLTIYLGLLGAIGFRIVANLRRHTSPTAIGALMLFFTWMVDTIGLVPSAYPGWQWFIWGMIGWSIRKESAPVRTVSVAVLPEEVTQSPRTEAAPRFAMPPMNEPGHRYPIIT